MLGKEYVASGAVIGKGASGILVGKVTSKFQIIDPATGNIQIDIAVEIMGDIFGANPKNADVRVGVLGGALNAGLKIAPTDGYYSIGVNGEGHGFFVEVSTGCICVKGRWVKLTGQFVFIGADASVGSELDHKLRTAYAHLDATAKIIEWKGIALSQLAGIAAVELEGSANAGIGGGGEIGVINLIPHVSKIKISNGIGGSSGAKLIRLKAMKCKPNCKN